MNSKYFIISGLSFIIALTSGCSLLKDNQNTTNNTTVLEQLSIPPSLKNTTQQAAKNVNANYFIVVGTYPNQEQALDTFVRLSSVGLSNAAMETRQTSQGQTLHMVRLGPYNNQDEIDKTKDTLTSSGLSQFKLVKN